MIHVAFFGHDSADAAVRRRARAFRDDGATVTGFMMRRRDDAVIDWDNIDLGKTYDAALLHRLRTVISGARKAAAHRDALAAADVIYARNLDMLATAFLARALTGLRTPVIYECLDVHRLLTRPDPIGFIFRRFEGALLKRCARLVVSSPGFLDNHFNRRHAGTFTPVLIENRLAPGPANGPRPSAPRLVAANAPLRIGWFGVLRCSRSLDLLLALAREFGDRLRIDLRGYPALTEIPDFHERIQGLPNVTYHGRYRAPEDLREIYDGVDVVWAGDFMEAGYNSVWLLPNRLYEGGYHGAPPIVPAGTQSAAWAARHSAGFEVAEDLAATLPRLIETLIADRSLVLEKRKRLLDMPADAFVQPPGVLRALVEDVIGEATHGEPAPLDTANPARTIAR